MLLKAKRGREWVVSNAEADKVVLDFFFCGKKGMDVLVKEVQ